MVLISLFDLWGELGPKIDNCEATPPKRILNIIKFRRGMGFTIVVPTLVLIIDSWCEIKEQCN